MLHRVQNLVAKAEKQNLLVIAGLDPAIHPF
jgi:hypothetical protein